MLKQALCVLAACVAMTSPVFAADLDEAPVFIEAPVVQQPVAKAGSGWYLRGDIGWTKGSNNEGSWDFYNQFVGYQGIDDTYRFDRIRFADAFSGGLGVGYRFNQNLRADVTLDYFKTDVSTKTRCPFMFRTIAFGMADPVNGHCDIDGESSATVWSPMVNAYADLGQFGKITPYVGAGVGAALVKYDTRASQESCRDCPPTRFDMPDYVYIPYKTTMPGESEWRLSGALMAGAAIRVTDKALLDIGYKLTHVRGGDAWGYDAADVAHGATGAQSRDNGFNFHAIRAGVRYEFN